MGAGGAKLNNMKRIILLSISILVLSYVSAFSQALEDVIYLKNGGIMRGTIIEQVPNQSLKLQTHDKNVFVYKFDEVEKITKEAVQSTANHDDSYLYPGLSLALSFVVPGAGQFYNGQYSKSAIIFVSSGLMFGLAMSFDNAEGQSHGQLKEFLFGYSCIWVYSMIDAPVCAIKINNKNRLSYRFSPTVLNLAMNNKPYPGLNFSVKF